MMVCSQCNSKGATIGNNDILDLNLNTIQYFFPQGKPSAQPCTQCRGLGYMTGGSF